MCPEISFQEGSQSIERGHLKGGDSAKSSCPSPTIYLPPDNCHSACYKDIGVMIDDINQSIAEGTPFIATICSGTHHYPTDKNVNGYTEVSEVIVRCCGLQNSCIIDGGGPDQRSTPLFYFVSTVRHLVVEGIKFQNIKCNGDDLDWYRCSGSLIHTKGVAVASLRNLTVDSAVTNRMVSFYVYFVLVKQLIVNAKYHLLTMFYLLLKTQGGAFYINEGDATIEGCTFTNNHAELTGGVNRADASMTLYGNTFHGNSANSGGAMEAAKSTDVICNTFENNSAKVSGGAIYSELDKIRLSYNMFLEK